MTKHTINKTRKRKKERKKERKEKKRKNDRQKIEGTGYQKQALDDKQIREAEIFI